MGRVSGVALVVSVLVGSNLVQAAAPASQIDNSIKNYAQVYLTFLTKENLIPSPDLAEINYLKGRISDLKNQEALVNQELQRTSPTLDSGRKPLRDNSQTYNLRAEAYRDARRILDLVQGRGLNQEIQIFDEINLTDRLIDRNRIVWATDSLSRQADQVYRQVEQDLRARSQDFDDRARRLESDRRNSGVETMRSQQNQLANLIENKTRQTQSSALAESQLVQEQSNVDNLILQAQQEIEASRNRVVQLQSVLANLAGQRKIAADAAAANDPQPEINALTQEKAQLLAQSKKDSYVMFAYTSLREDPTPEQTAEFRKATASQTYIKGRYAEVEARLKQLQSNPQLALLQKIDREIASTTQQLQAAQASGPAQQNRINELQSRKGQYPQLINEARSRTQALRQEQQEASRQYEMNQRRITDLESSFVPRQRELESVKRDLQNLQNNSNQLADSARRVQSAGVLLVEKVDRINRILLDESQSEALPNPTYQNLLAQKQVLKSELNDVQYKLSKLNPSSSNGEALNALVAIENQLQQILSKK